MTFYFQLLSKVKQTTKLHRQAHERLKELQDAIEDAEDDCNNLADELETLDDDMFVLNKYEIITDGEYRNFKNIIHMEQYGELPAVGNDEDEEEEDDYWNDDDDEDDDYEE